MLSESSVVIMTDQYQSARFKYSGDGLSRVVFSRSILSSGTDTF